jgi:hypothetical protein
MSIPASDIPGRNQGFGFMSPDGTFHPINPIGGMPPVNPPQSGSPSVNPSNSVPSQDSPGNGTSLLERVQEAFWPTMRILTIAIALSAAVVGAFYAVRKITNEKDIDSGIKSAIDFTSVGGEIALVFCEEEIGSFRDYATCFLRCFAKISELMLRSSLINLQERNIHRT